eukprot:CAMPEP_0183797806 /NCGR_PEP_ID=MMETSP0803_2-20130417/17143_1 /TAXON_ID=195967 /ORGANISM="Crustomastix stigmata, Strain CCMP3273" /LENGTH=46 /DNA_ID= /DNA_START= /DNA_END= /DNA_ORIENTATION=
MSSGEGYGSITTPAACLRCSAARALMAAKSPLATSLASLASKSRFI